MAKTLAQLKKELMIARKKNTSQEAKLRKQDKDLAERRKVEKELKELNTSSFMKRLKKFSKKKLTKEEAEKAGKKLQKGAKIAFKKTQWLVNKLDKLGR